MKAMILAAGFGTRLGAAGKTTPKCLMQAGGKTLLELVVENLRAAGIGEIIINLHHLGDRIERFVTEERKSFGLKVHFSNEDTILGTGGGIKQARRYFENEDCFLVHNGDVYSELNLTQMIARHRETSPVATLAVMERPGSRQLLFDGGGHLCGWESRENDSPSVVGAPAEIRRRVFSGIHVLSPAIFEEMEGENGEFSIIRSYISAVRKGRAVRELDMKDAYWIDAGTPERLSELSAHLASRK